MKIVVRILIVLICLVVLVVGSLAAYVQLYLPHVGTAPELKVTATPELVARGDYLVNHVTGCLDCHSGHDHSRFSDPVQRGTEGKGGEVFDKEDGVPGVLTAKNITPFHLKNWTDGELFRAITTGENKDGQPLFPLMPYPHFNQMDSEDIKAIIAYIRTLKPITNDPTPSKLEFPMNWIVRTIPMKYEPQSRPSITDSVSYGKYMVNAASCADCHTPMDDHGQYIETKSFAGGVEFPVPSGGKCHTANITPDKETGIGLWTEEMFVEKFRQYANPDSMPKVEHGQYNTIMPWSFYGGMKEEDLRTIYQYLQTLPPIRNQVEKFTMQ